MRETHASAPAATGRSRNGGPPPKAAPPQGSQAGPRLGQPPAPPPGPHRLRTAVPGRRGPGRRRLAVCAASPTPCTARACLGGVASEPLDALPGKSVLACWDSGQARASMLQCDPHGGRAVGRGLSLGAAGGAGGRQPWAREPRSAPGAEVCHGSPPGDTPCRRHCVVAGERSGLRDPPEPVASLCSNPQPRMNHSAKLCPSSQSLGVAWAPTWDGRQAPRSERV